MWLIKIFFVPQKGGAAAPPAPPGYGPGHNSVIFQARSFKFCVVADIEITDKLGREIQKGVWHLGFREPITLHHENRIYPPQWQGFICSRDYFCQPIHPSGRASSVQEFASVNLSFIFWYGIFSLGPDEDGIGSTISLWKIFWSSFKSSF